MSKFIGSGILFPIKLSEAGRPDFVSNMSLIICSMKIILNWPRNIRFFNELFGTRNWECLEEPNDGITKSLLRTFSKDGLEKYEKRIEVLDVSVQSHDRYKVNLLISFRLRNTKIEETLIFPYYKIIS